MDNVSSSEARVIVYDGSAIFANRFSKRIHPKGSEVEIFDATERSADPERAFFRFDPRKLPDKLLDVNQAYAKFPDIRFEKREGGGYKGFLYIPDVHIHFSILPEYGFNVASYELLNGGKKPAVQDNRAVWENVDGVWFVKQLTYETHMGGGQVSRWILSYEQFRPNAPVPQELFTFASLKLPPGARLIDHRSGKIENRVFRNTPAHDTEPTKIDSLVEQLKTLQVSDTAPAAPNRALRWILLVAGGALILVGLTLVALRLRKPA